MDLYTLQAQAKMRQFNVKYDDPLRQQTLCGLTTMNKPGTLPVSCYEMAVPPIHHLNLAEIIGDSTTNVRATLYTLTTREVELATDKSFGLGNHCLAAVKGAASDQTVVMVTVRL